MWMTRVAINHPVFATMVMVALTVIGIFSYQRLRVEAMPDVRPPFVAIKVDYPGASPEQFENDVAKPIENAVNTVAGVKRLLSASYEGFGWTWVEFRLNVDQDRVLQETRDKVAQIRASFSRDVKDPVVQRGGDENDEPVAFYGLVGDNVSARELTRLAEEVVQKGLERVHGVGRVQLGGTVTRQIHVRVDAARLIALGLTVDQLVAALKNANVAVPVGSVSNKSAEAIVRVDGRIGSPKDFGRIVVARKGGVPILLSQLAEVVDGERERVSIARINGTQAVSFQVFKAQDANIVEVGENLKRAAGAREGTEEIGLAVLATTFSIVAVFVPIAFMSGIVGKFFFPFGITVAAAVLVSLFVSFTLDPMLSAVWRDPPEGARKLPLVGPLVRWFDRVLEQTHAFYDQLLRAALAHRLATLGIAAAAFAVAIPLAKVVGTEMMPQADESFTSLRLTLPVGSSLEYADERVTRVEQALREFREIEVIDTSIGTEGGKNTARINLKLVPRSARKRSQKELEQAIRARLAATPGVELRVGWNPQIYVALLGNDDAEMQRVMDDFKQKVAAIRGVTDLEISLKEGTPALSIRLKPMLASEVGLTHAQLGATLRAFIGGENSGYWLAPDGQNYEVITQLPRASRTALEDIANLNIATGRALADGMPEVVPLRSVATIERVFNPENIRRQDLQRRIALFANVEGRPAGDAGEEVKALVKSYALPPGLRLSVGGQIEDQEEVNQAIVGALAMAVLFIYIVLASQFASFVQPVALMASLPLSLVGVMLALLFTGTTLNIFSMIGLVFLMGLVTKNAILLVDFANQGQRRGMSRDEALIAAGQVRLRPILMTTTAMIFGMLPLALGLGEGAEQQAPLGRATFGGVST